MQNEARPPVDVVQQPEAGHVLVWCWNEEINVYDSCLNTKTPVGSGRVHLDTSVKEGTQIIIPCTRERCADVADTIITSLKENGIKFLSFVH